ncbi:glycerophosphoryl diester phosphodiesterase [Sporobacter termitidis DSM 10068]|uniref:Glycerophosphoryl diester phosphodiesterase n=1 Tax=Sporobacter termitidis DSM 10068 TaxID=1123282 RepID=A0A1M5VPW1_9FIRM|nr:glycerophosphodiester phosphodiesterase family protein [Sporobacter termitidis]SHH77275.1 glycerophosphoryl diester phosphodiesterase [Sporobacter termitidis DSM 10068]
MAAYELALDMGADAIELDVQLTKDGQVVVIHDLSINRTSDGKGFVRDMTYHELSRHVYAYKFKEKYDLSKCRLLKLEEVLDFASKNDLFLNIETKDYTDPRGKVNAMTARLVREFNYAEKSLISSINHNAVAYLKEEFPEIKTAIAFMTGIYDLPAYARTCRAEVLHPISYIVDEPFMEMARGAGFEVNVWTVDNIEELSKLQKLGVTGIMTNTPDLFCEALNK